MSSYNVNKYIVIGGIAIVVAGVVIVYYNHEKSRGKTLDRFTGDQNLCITGCNKDCTKACSKSMEVRSGPRYDLGDRIMEKCVGVCEDNIAACKRKCNGCTACA